MPEDTPRGQADATDPSRRTFLAGAGAAALAGLTAAACGTQEAGDAAPEPTAPAGPTDAPDVAGALDSAEPPAGPTAEPSPRATASPAVANRVPFAGARQPGVLLRPAAAGLVATFDAIAGSRDELAETMRVLSDEIERIMAGRPAVTSDDFLPPPDSGALDAEAATTATAITVAVGASLFDERFGLSERRPTELIAMPRFFNDRFVDPDRSHGDVCLMIAADSPQATAYALQQAVRVTERRLRLRWVQEGHNQLLPPSSERIAPTRNLMGFRDGTSNLDTSDPAVMDEHVWVQPGDDEPEWAVGGTYLAARVIRMLIEFWATAALVRQEQIFGRHRDTGAPLGQTTEGEIPAFVDDPSDEGVPRASHMRRANPRTPGTGRILRRGFSYLNGADAQGTLDQGLLFLAFQRSLSHGFLEVQARLDGEPLEDYIKPVGGGFYFVLPGPGDGWLGQSLFT